MERLERQTRTRDANGRYLNAKLAAIPGIRPMARDRGEHGTPITSTCSATTWPHSTVFPVTGSSLRSRPRGFRAAAAIRWGCPPAALRAAQLRPLRGYRLARPDLHYDPADYPVCEQACEEAVWLSQQMMLGPRADMDDIFSAVSKIYEHRRELAA